VVRVFRYKILLKKILEEAFQKDASFCFKLSFRAPARILTTLPKRDSILNKSLAITYGGCKNNNHLH